MGSNSRSSASASTRRFSPIPIETSTRSSKSPSSRPLKTSTTMNNTISSKMEDHKPTDHPESTDHSPPRNRILPQPIETTAKSTRRVLPQPIETSTRNSKPQKTDEPPETRRRFLPEPIESTKSSNRPPASPASSDSSQPAPRRFLPQPVETSSKSSKGRASIENSSSASGDTVVNDAQNRPVRRFRPEPIESVKISRKKGGSRPGTASDSASSSSGPVSTPDRLPGAPLRKFTPQLIETAKRSFRKGEATAALAVNGNADHLLGYLGHLRNTRLPRPSVIAPTMSDELGHHTDPLESRFSHASISSRQTNRQENRRHSFRVPDLPSIPSNSSPRSGQSVVSSLSTSPSSPVDESSQHSKIRRQCRESCDERFSGYLLSLAARSAEKQLIDQTLAAFPNEQVYQTVSHFAIDREDEEDTDQEGDNVEVVLRDLKGDIGTFRRESTADLLFELDHLRTHKERAESAHRETLDEPTESRFSAAAIAARQPENAIVVPDDTSKEIIGGWQKGVGLAQMREAASPPMLGADIVFPKSLSPQSTRCDVDHVPVPQHGEADGETPEKREAPLWTPEVGVDGSGEGGLWKGMCTAAEEADQPQHKIPRLGIMTPAPETENQPFFQNFESALTTAEEQLPTPPPSDPQLDGMNNVLNLEEEIDREFGDSFITQIYNYLSLGYPAMAHSFDFELSKITRIPVEELRRDDQLANAKGYVGAPEGLGVDDDGVASGKCMRWTALRLYIREWARQQPWMGRQESTMDAWGVRARRGSWAF